VIVKFSKVERTAGLFVLVAVAIFVFSTVVIATKQGWFSKHHNYSTTFTQGEGLHSGTLVQIAGLRAGSVNEVALDEDNKIRVKLTVDANFAKKVREDSVARVIRPFVIGDKVVEITVGSKDSKLISDGSVIPGTDSMDVMDLLGGGKLGPYLDTVDSLLKNLQVVAQAFADPKRSQAMIGMFDEALPTMKDIREVSQEMTHNKAMRKSLDNMGKLMAQMNEMAPDLREFSKRLPELGNDGAKTVAEMARMTDELNKILPVLSQVAPQLPQVSQESLAALKEAVIVLRAMQRSFLLRGAVKDVKEEDAKEDAKKQEDMEKQQQSQQPQPQTAPPAESDLRKPAGQ